VQPRAIIRTKLQKGEGRVQRTSRVFTVGEAPNLRLSVDAVGVVDDNSEAGPTLRLLKSMVLPPGEMT